MSRPWIPIALWLLLILGAYRHQVFPIHAPERVDVVAGATLPAPPD